MHVLSTKNYIFFQSFCGGHADRKSAPTPLYFYEKEEWMYRQTGQGKFVPDHSMKVKGANRGTVPLILDLGAKRGS